MRAEREGLRDWHRLFGLILTDFFADSPFVVEVERDLSQQQQLLDVVVVRRRRGKVTAAFPDGMDDLAEHNLITFKSLHEALDDWAVRELIGHYVAYRKLVSSTPTDLLPAERFHLYAVCARFPHNLASQVPWQERRPGVYDCRWGLDTLRVIVAGQLSREPRNAPLHLFSASPELVGFGQGAYRRRSQRTSRLLAFLFEKFRQEGLTMSFTMEDFNHWYTKEFFSKLTPAEQREAVQGLSPKARRQLLKALLLEEGLEGTSEENARQPLDQSKPGRPAQPRKSRRKR